MLLMPRGPQHRRCQTKVNLIFLIKLPSQASRCQTRRPSAFVPLAVILAALRHKRHVRSTMGLNVFPGKQTLSFASRTLIAWA